MKNFIDRFILWLIVGLSGVGFAAESELIWDTGSTQVGTQLFSTNSPAGTYAFKVTTPVSANSVGYWRSVLNVTSGEANLYLKKGSVPTVTDSDRYSETVGDDSIVLPLKANEEWFIMVNVTEAAQWSLLAGDLYVESLTWDGGSKALGTAMKGEVSSTGEDRYFKLVTENADFGMWRTVLNVTDGDASFYLSQGVLPRVTDAETSFEFKSDRVGDDGLVLPLSNSAGSGQTWYILVKPQVGASWNLFSGDVFVTDLGALAADDSSGSGVSKIPAEGVRYFKTTMPVAAMAWRLWLQDEAGVSSLNKTLVVRKGLAPSPTDSKAYDRSSDGQLLLVPSYLVPGGGVPYYVGVTGTPGDEFQLDSRQQAVESINYNGTVSAAVEGFRFKTYRVDVPADLISWDLTLTPESGNPDMAVSLAKIPNAFNNLAFSELDSATESESITLVPPFLSSGAYYITLYSPDDYSFSLRNKEPTVTPIHYVSVTVNDNPARSGWRFYSVTDINEQLGSLGWLLTLKNHVPDTEIAIRRNSLPGGWNYRSDGSESIKKLNYSDKNSSVGFLQDPAHISDVWYVGVYSATAALGSFELTGAQMSAVEMAMTGTVSKRPMLMPKSWDFFHVTVPSTINDETLLGWELRLSDVTGGAPKLVVRRDLMVSAPATSGKWGVASQPHLGDAWPSGSTWASSAGDWSGYTSGADTILSMAMGRPLEPGGYYVGVYNGSADQGCEYTFNSQAVGAGMDYEVTPVAFAGGSVTNLALPAREVAYFEVDVPSNKPNWKIHLENVSGESQLYIRKGYIPTWGQAGTGYSSPGEQNDPQIKQLTHLKKPGDEYFVLFPEDCYDNVPNGEPVVRTIPPGIYYLMVVSEGEDPEAAKIGQGSSDVILHSVGVIAPVELGELNQDEILGSDGSYAAGEINWFQFTIGSGVGWYRPSITNSIGESSIESMYYIVPEISGFGSYYGGMYSGYNKNEWLHIPAVQPYNLIVSDPRSASQVEAGQYHLSVSRVPSTEIDFDEGGDSVANLCGSVVYRVDVPAASEGVEGWEIRLTEWSGSLPTLTVCRERFPSPYALGSTLTYYESKSWSPHRVTYWEWADQWAVIKGDWTGYAYDANHMQSNPQYVMSMGVDRPLVPGSTYYLCFDNTGCSTLSSFSFESRGIGPGMHYEPASIPFAGGSATITDLAAREVSYFTVDVPKDVASWKVKLENTSGETSLYIRKDTPPTTGQTSAGFYSPGLSTGKDIDKVTRLEKEGDEYFVLLPEGTNATVTAGSYYLMVVGLGQDPEGTDLGTGTSSAVLHSLGSTDIIDLGKLSLTGEIEQTGAYAAGESVLYQFTVPEGVNGMEVRLNNVEGSPKLNLASGTSFPEVDDASRDRYAGLYSGLTIDDTMRGFEVVTAVAPTSGVWSLLISDPLAAASLTDGSYTLSILTLSTEEVPFSGSTTTVTNLGAQNWAFYNVTVPAADQPGGGFIGWELRVKDWVGEKPPIMAVCRNTLPEGLTTRTDSGGNWTPSKAVVWPAKYQWATTSSPKEWTGYTYEAGRGKVYAQYLLSMAKDRPLEPGNYLIGFYNPSSKVASGFTFESRTIGTEGDYPVTDIDFDGGSVPITELQARGVAYFKVSVPVDVPSWNVQLENVSGESMLYIRKDYVPTWTQAGSSVYSPDVSIDKVVKLQKLGDEHYTLLPDDGETLIPGGDYYLMVVSEGVGPTTSDVGSGCSSAVLHSLGVDPVVDLGALHAGAKLTQSVQYDGGDVRLYQFTVDADNEAIELRLSERVGTPNMNLLSGSCLPANAGYGGLFSGYADEFDGKELITIPNVTTGLWSLVVSDPNTAASLTDGSCTLTVTSLPASTLNADQSVNTNGNSHASSGSLIDDQSRFFKVEIPELFEGEPVSGWYLNTDTPQGEVLLRARQGALPDDANRTQTGWGEGALMVVPPLLTPGTWYLELKGVGATAYTLSSRFVLPKRTWIMPAIDQPVTALGLDVPLFGDTGVTTNGVPLADDQGVDLNCGRYDVYAVTVPKNNAGLLNTRLEVISGNPDLYIRKGNMPTLNHDADNSGYLYDHVSKSTEGTEYGNWVPLDGRNEHLMEPGTWFIMVKAEGTSDARYRLKLASGTAYAGGNVQNISLESGSYSGQVLAKGDWRYYRVVMPDPVPVQWNVGFSIVSGDVDLFLRDTIPPGNVKTFSDSASYIVDWRKDDKTDGAESYYPDAGVNSISHSMLFPGKTYYMGLFAKEDSSFNVSSDVVAGIVPAYPEIDFYNGVINTNILAGESVTYRVQVPADALRWVHSISLGSGVTAYLKQGSLPVLTWVNQVWGSGNHYLMSNAWPWVQDSTYYLTVTNGASSAAAFKFYMAGTATAERPTQVDVSDGTQPNFARVSWRGVTGAFEYDIWRSTLPEIDTAMKIGEAAGYSYDDYAADPGITHYYWVALAGVSGAEWLSDSDSGWFSGKGTISKDSFDFGYEGGTAEIAITAPDATLWSSTTPETWIVLPSSSVSNGNGSVTFTVKMTAAESARTTTINVAGNPVTIKQAAYGVVENVNASDEVYPDRVVVTWDEKPDAVSYVVRRAERNNIVYSSYQGAVSTNQYVDVSAKQDVTYYYWVTVLNAGGSGGASASDAGSCRPSALSVWINKYFADGYGGDDLDADADGFSNADEFIAGTDPTNATSYFCSKFMGMDAHGLMQFKVQPAVSGRVYDLQSCNRLDGAEWTDMGVPKSGHDEDLILPVYGSGDILFVRPTVRLK